MAKLVAVNDVRVRAPAVEIVKVPKVVPFFWQRKAALAVGFVKSFQPCPVAGMVKGRTAGKIRIF
jgi:hypothetical protein